VTVAELMDKLAKLPPRAIVAATGYDGSTYDVVDVAHLTEDDAEGERWSQHPRVVLGTEGQERPYLCGRATGRS
jgi:hypothetical protein